MAEHDGYTGRLSLPYITTSGVASIRFRALDDGGSGPRNKYLQPSGSGVWLYNAGVLAQSPELVVVCEGELDAIVCNAYGGIPAVAIAGTNGWKPSFAKCFENAAMVLVAGDGDAAGEGMTTRLCQELPNARPAQMPAGEDINSFYLARGAEALTDFLLERT